MKRVLTAVLSEEAACRAAEAAISSGWTLVSIAGASLSIHYWYIVTIVGERDLVIPKGFR